MIAAMVRRITKTYFRFLFMNAGVRMPTFVRKKTMIGNSKTSPQAIVTETTVLIYELRVIVFVTEELTW